jgi:putative NADH-flavin reductase
VNIVVFGANGSTGRLLTQQALAEGHTVGAFTRHPETFPLTHDRLQVISGDVLDAAAVDQAISGQGAVLSTLGGPFSRKPTSLLAQGTTNMVQAMQHHGVRRLVCVSSSAIDPHDDPEEGFFFRKVLQPFFIGVVGRGTYADMRLMESTVMTCGLDWTIVRPSGLFRAPVISDYTVAEAQIGGRFTSRADLADFMLHQVTDGRYVHKAAAMTTVVGVPNFLGFLWNEGIRKKPA